jgi:phosphopantothenoylcysteine decarboxylase/phosphopantothenate--cysteine ligase
VPSPLRGKKVLITAGPTREHLDPIRFMTNASSGRAGLALAKAALARGARVVVVLGPTDLEFPRSVKVVRVTTGMEMYEAALREAKGAAVAIGAAAVSDWRFQSAAPRKLKRRPGPLRLTLLPNPDIIMALARRRSPRRIVVGFALETHAAARFARRKLEKKGLDAIVANGPESLAGDSFSKAVVYTRGGAARPLNARSKDAAARKIVGIIEELVGK